MRRSGRCLDRAIARIKAKLDKAAAKGQLVRQENGIKIEEEVLPLCTPMVEGEKNVSEYLAVYMNNLEAVCRSMGIRVEENNQP